MRKNNTGIGTKREKDYIMKNFLANCFGILMVALIQVAIILIALTPTWGFLLIKYILSPEGFWQKLIVFGIGFYLLAGLQLICLILGFYASLMFWFEVAKK